MSPYLELPRLDARRLGRKRLTVRDVTRRHRLAPKDPSLLSVEAVQLALYKPMILDRVARRFSTRDAAVAWFEAGTVTGFDRSPAALVRAGLGAQVIEAVNAIEAGVHA